jgi:16S rRNA G966 N2-methylase RsmD
MNDISVKSKEDLKQIFIKNRENLKEIFGDIENLEYLQLTNKSLYSISCFSHAKKITEIIYNFTKDWKEDIVITDCNACIGGNALSFVRDLPNLKFLTCVEKDTLHGEMLDNNLRCVSSKGNFAVYIEDYISIYKEIKQDIIFLDPPWEAYYKNKEIFYSHEEKGKRKIVKLSDFVACLTNHCKLVCIKLPKFYSVNLIINKCGFAYKELLFLKCIDTKKSIFNLLILSHIKPPENFVNTVFVPKFEYRNIEISED